MLWAFQGGAEARKCKLQDPGTGVKRELSAVSSDVVPCLVCKTFPILACGGLIRERAHPYLVSSKHMGLMKDKGL